MRAIYKRELQSYLRSLVGWIVLAVTFFMMGIYFTALNLMSGYPTISYLLQSVVFLCIFTVPILTMRSFSEEKKRKTDQLLLTAPITPLKIVLGKYLAVTSVFAIPVVVLALTPLALMQAGEFQIGISYSALIGFFLYGCLALAIGVFISSRTESVVISALLSIVVLFTGYLMGGICNLVSAIGTSKVSDVVVNILSIFDMTKRFDDLCSGYFDLTCILYFLTFIFIMLFLTTRLLNGFRLGKLRRATRTFTNIVVILATIAVNIGAGYIPKQYTSFDVTANQIYSLTEDSKQRIKDLKDEIEIYVLAEETSKDEDLDKTLREICGLSDFVSLEYVSPVTNPKFYYNYTNTEPSNNSLIVVSKDKSKVIDHNDIYAYDIDYSTYQYKLTGYDGEGQIMSAISYVSMDYIPKYYMITGHNELPFTENFLNALKKENLDYEELNLYSVDSIPTDVDGIIINAPIVDFSEEDVQKVITFLEEGKNAFLVAAWTEEKLPNYEKILEFYGVNLVDGMIVENDRNFYYSQSQYYLIPSIEMDEMTESVYGSHVFSPFTKGLSYDESKSDVSYKALLRTSVDSFSQKQAAKVENFEKSEGDPEGPFTISLRAEKTLSDKAVSSAVITASESIFTDEADIVFPGNNQKLFGCMISKLSKQENSVYIPVKNFEIGYLSFNAAISLVTSLFAVFVIPFGCIITGLVIWLKRRKK